CASPIYYYGSTFDYW
nr:immunoglobulin heavy chain junction region [Mus musculus]